MHLVSEALPSALGLDLSDVRVVAPRRGGPAGTRALNAALKAALNPGPGDYGGFDPGDRVVSPAGEATIVTATPDGLVLRAAAAEASESVLPWGNLRSLEHGWAVTAHQALGHRWPAVVAVLPGDATGVLSRPMVYTAFTRAERRLCVVSGVGSALAHAVATVRGRPRRTRLAGLLSGGPV